MSRHVLADNWSLQHVSDLLSSGISMSEASVIRICGDEHRYDDVSEGLVQTESLFDLLTEIVLRDEIIVDAAFCETWDTPSSSLHSLSRAGILRRVQFLDGEDKFSELRQFFVERLCVTESLTSDHAENVNGWSINKRTPNPYLSAVLWGGAGMVARSAAFDTSYSPHPLRRRFFMSAGLFLDGNSAYAKLNSVVDENRLRVAKRASATDLLYSMNVTLPPIPIRIIEQSETATDLINVALQLRSDFAPVREWLTATEDLILKDDFKAVRKKYAQLDDISANIDRILGNDVGKTTLSVGIGFLKLSTKIAPLTAIRNRFGFRSILNSMILDSSGQAALKKYCRLFGVAGTATELNLQEHFSRTD
jgi:hypothetical protein